MQSDMITGPFCFFTQLNPTEPIFEYTQNLTSCHSSKIELPYKYKTEND